MIPKVRTQNSLYSAEGIDDPDAPGFSILFSDTSPKSLLEILNFPFFFLALAPVIVNPASDRAEVGKGKLSEG